jgi:HD-GYP domain-containing protein (c-di-GMP phosphodiesterase class II)
MVTLFTYFAGDWWGRQFDPDIVDAFLACFTEIVAATQKYQEDS